jgi:hypothetical protein
MGTTRTHDAQAECRSVFARRGMTQPAPRHAGRRAVCATPSACAVCSNPRKRTGHVHTPSRTHATDTTPLACCGVTHCNPRKSCIVESVIDVPDDTRRLKCPVCVARHSSGGHYAAVGGREHPWRPSEVGSRTLVVVCKQRMHCQSFNGTHMTGRHAHAARTTPNATSHHACSPTPRPRHVWVCCCCVAVGSRSRCTVHLLFHGAAFSCEGHKWTRADKRSDRAPSNLDLGQQ